VCEKKITILIADDEPNIRSLLEDFLTNQGYITISAKDGYEAIDFFFENKKIDLVILDIMMPGIDGNEVCKMIREHSKVPVLMLTAKDQPEDEVEGLGNGADDYIGKPFRHDILMARIKALLRRNKGHSRKVGYKDLTIDDIKREARLGDSILQLSPKEYELLLLFLENSGKALSREKILETLWGYEFEGDCRVVDTNIKNLRAKLGEYKYCIRTVRNYGYRFGEV